MSVPASIPEWARWLPWLPETERQQVLGYMRVLRGESEDCLARARKLMPRHGEIAAGAAGFGDWIRGESIAVLLGALNKGYSPLCAAADAKMFSRDAIKLHNQKRPKDVNWQRWDQGEWARLDRIQMELSRFSAICPGCNAIPSGDSCPNCGAPSCAYRPRS